MRSDIEIAQSTPLRPIADIARERLGLPDDALVPFGRHKAKITLAHLRSLESRPDGRLLAFAILDESVPGGALGGRRAMDRALAELVECDCAQR